MAMIATVVPAEGPTPRLDERSKYLRRLIVRGLAGGQRGHIGSSLSLVEIIRVLYDEVLRYRPQEPGWRGVQNDLFEVFGLMPNQIAAKVANSLGKMEKVA